MQVVDRLVPLATSQLIIENDFVPDLPNGALEGRRDHRINHPGRLTSR